ncbi:hypothetical protein DV738_g1600, partial [Chaetothyriales sp. CBS 135597]
MASVLKPEAQHDEGAAWKPSKGQKFKNFIRKTWWMWLILAIVITVILVPVLLLVIYPHIAQSAVNKASIVVTSLAALSPAANSISLDINNTFIIHSSYHPTLYPFNASLYLDDEASTPFVSFESPKINHVKNGSWAVVQETVPIYNLDGFTAFVKKALVSDSFNVTLRGKGKLKEGGLTKTGVTWHQNASITGLGGLSQINVASVTLLSSPLSDGSNAQGVIELYNPSVFTMDLGNVTLSLTGPSPNNTALGTSTLINAVLKPGSNTLTSNIVADVLAIASLITTDSRYGCAVFPISLQGINSTVNGELIPYYTAALQDLQQTTTLNLTTTLQTAGLGSAITTCSS